MNKLPYDLKRKVMNYLPILDYNTKIINGIIKNYKYYFMNTLIEEYNKYYDEPSLYLYIEMCMLEWDYTKLIIDRMIINKIDATNEYDKSNDSNESNESKLSLKERWLLLFNNKWSYSECKTVIMNVINECTLKEIQYLYLFITCRLQTPCF